MRRVLLIDDDKDDAELFKEALEEVNATISFHHFKDAREALEKLSDDRISPPDIIFLDINLPVMSGWECLTRFKKTEHLSSVPVIMYTTSSLPREKDIAQELGAAGFITKPNDYNLLKEILQKTLQS